MIIDPAIVDLTIVDFTCATAYAPGTGSVLAGQFPPGQFPPGIANTTRFATMPQIQNPDKFSEIMDGMPGGSHGGKKRGQTKRRRHKSRASRHQKRGYKKMRSIRKHKTRAAR